MSETERLVRLLYADLQRIAVDDGDGVVGVEKVAEGGGAALFGEGAFNAVAGDAQRQAADLRFIVADIAAVPSAAILMVVVQPSKPMVWVSL